MVVADLATRESPMNSAWLVLAGATLRSDNECSSPPIEVSVVLSNLGILGLLAVSRDLCSVSSMVVLNLETKKVMNCFQRVGICCFNTH